MLLVPNVYRQIYNQGFAIGWNQAWADHIAQAHQDAQAWQERKDAAHQAGLPFTESHPANFHMTRPGYRPPPPPWQEPELPAWLALTQIGVIACLAAAVAAAILLVSG